MTKLLTINYKKYLAEQIYEALTEESNTAFYVYTGVHGDVIGDIPDPDNDNRELVVDAYRNMIFGKRVRPQDMAMVVRYIPYEANKVFAMYDDNDAGLLEKDFYCMVDEDSYIHIYKCLNNNFNANSTVEPIFTYVTADSNYTFNTSDGYVWKYMYSVSDIDKDKFSTQNYFPIIDNPNVAATAINGSVDVIRIEQSDLEIPGGGKKYDNYLAGAFTTEQLRVNGNNFVYAITNTSISFQTGFYTGCMLYLTGGAGVGQYSVIGDYFHNGLGNFIVLESEFPIQPLNGTTYEIYPSVKITGSGTETVPAVARALVNSTGSNSVYKVEMLEKGADYDYISANVVANGVITQDVAFRAAELHPIYSPSYGHGNDPAEELGCSAVAISVKFANSEGGTLLTGNRFQQVGMITNPLFNNVVVQMTGSSGSFQSDEKVFKVRPLRINSNVNISNTTAVITGETSVLANATIIGSGTSGSYIPADILAISGGTPIEGAEVIVVKTNVRTVAINAHGSGYTPGTFTANLNVGTAVVNATFTVSVNSIGQCNSIVLVLPGEYTTNPPFLANSTPVGGGAGAGLTLNLTMGLQDIDIFNPGSYAIIPTNLATNPPVSNIGTGTGATLLLDFDSTLTADFLNQVSGGEYVYFTNPEGTLQQLTTVNTVTNSSYLTISTNGFFSCSVALMYSPRMTTSADVVRTSNATHVVLSNVNEELTTGDLIVGEQSGAKTTVLDITRNDVNKDFDSFIQLYKYGITVLSGDFMQNEILYQGDSLEDATATALLHSLEGTGSSRTLYTSNQIGQFTQSDHVFGVSSLAVADINSQYSPELKFGSGDVLYIENIEPVTRAADKAEIFQIILTF